MTHYEQEIRRIRHICYANQRQLDLVISMRRYIDQHLDQDLNLDFLSQVHCTSKYHLLRLFKRYHGQTPRQYLIGKRVSQSKIYLRQGMKVTATCYAVGFESPASFSTLFRKRVGMTPLAYQKRNSR